MYHDAFTILLSHPSKMHSVKNTYCCNFLFFLQVESISRLVLRCRTVRSTWVAATFWTLSPALSGPSSLWLLLSLIRRSPCLWDLQHSCWDLCGQVERHPQTICALVHAFPPVAPDAVCPVGCSALSFGFFSLQSQTATFPYWFRFQKNLRASS